MGVDSCSGRGLWPADQTHYLGLFQGAADKMTADQANEADVKRSAVDQFLGLQSKSIRKQAMQKDVTYRLIKSTWRCNFEEPNRRKWL